jgi:hypothetical protein
MMAIHFKTPIVLAGLLAIAGVTFFLARTAKAQVQFAASRRPFTVFVTEKHYTIGADGAVLSSAPAKIAGSTIRARRSDGSVAELALDPGSAEKHAAAILGGTIHNVSERTTIRFHTASNRWTALPLSDQDAIGMQAEAADPACRAISNLVEPAQLLGTGTFQGFPVVRLQLAGNPGSTTKLELWLSPDLGCEPLVQKTWFRRTAVAPFSALSVKEAVRIEMNEPEGYLFQSHQR